MIPEAVFGLASEHLDTEAAIIATAVAWAENEDLDPNVEGDLNLQDETWGPSIGLWQIRSLKAQLGTGKERDAQRLKDPAFNARSMATISAGGTNWTPWTMFRNGRYRAHLEAVRQAIGAGGTPLKLITRSQWGARSASLTDLDVAMVSVHWEGPHMGTPDHAQCAGIVRGFQAYHVDTMGWADIAYNAVVCPHGYVFEGRGLGKRSAANGTTAANSASYAICFMGGEGDTFTPEARDGINDAAEWLVPGTRRWGVHRDWVSTACPGDEITAWVRSGHPRANAAPDPTPDPTPVPVLEEDDMRIVNVNGRGIFLLIAGVADHINTPDQVIELVRVGVPYVAEEEMPAATFDRFFGGASVAASEVEYGPLLSDVRHRLAEATA